jgi:hypothetical protein
VAQSETTRKSGRLAIQAFKACLLALLLPTAMGGAAARAEEYSIGQLRVSSPWTLATPPSATVAGGFLTIVNSGSSADRLVSVTSDVAGKVDIHEMHIVNGVMMMRTVNPGIPVGPKATVTLKPFSHHLMLEDIKSQFKPGEKIKAILVFEKAGPLEIAFNVEPMGSNGPHAVSDKKPARSRSTSPADHHSH